MTRGSGLFTVTVVNDEKKCDILRLFCFSIAGSVYHAVVRYWVISHKQQEA